MSLAPKLQKMTVEERRAYWREDKRRSRARLAEIRGKGHEFRTYYWLKGGREKIIAWRKVNAEAISARNRERYTRLYKKRHLWERV